MEFQHALSYDIFQKPPCSQYPMSGATCTSRYDFCSQPNGNPCKNGGGCVLTNKNHPWFLCNCVTPYSGPTCTTLPDTCSTTPCKNSGVCTNTVIAPNFHDCECSYPFSGQDCSTRANTCSPNPCKNTGVCSLKGSSPCHGILR